MTEKQQNKVNTVDNPVVIEGIRIAANKAQEILLVGTKHLGERTYHQCTTNQEDFECLKERIKQHISLINDISVMTLNGTRILTVSLRVPSNHTNINDVAELCEFLAVIHAQVFDMLSMDETFENIKDDMKKFYEQ